MGEVLQFTCRLLQWGMDLSVLRIPKMSGSCLNFHNLYSFNWSLVQEYLVQSVRSLPWSSRAFILFELSCILYQSDEFQEMQYQCQTTERFLWPEVLLFGILTKLTHLPWLPICLCFNYCGICERFSSSKWAAKNVTGRCFPRASSFICIHSEKENWTGRRVGA